MPQSPGEAFVFKDSLEFMEVVKKECITQSPAGTPTTKRTFFVLELHYGYQLILYDTCMNWVPKIIK